MGILSRIRNLVESSPRAATAYRLLRDTRALSDEPQRTPHGFVFSGNQEMTAGTFETEEVDLFKRLLDSADVFIDVGANVGYYCCLALAQGRPTVAFEPMYTNLLYLYQNIHANGWDDHIEIFPLALSDRPGLREIYGGGVIASLVKGWASISPKYRSLIPASTLDTILGSRYSGQRCLFIVDVEGAEYDVLRGATVSLGMDPRPIWMVEVSVSQHQPDGIRVNPYLLQTFELFWQNGYEAWTINRGLRLIEPDEIRKMSTGGPKTYSGHNILFVERGAGARLLAP